MNSEKSKKISEEEFQEVISAQIQILNNIQSRSKSIINLTLAILAVIASIASVVDFTIPSITPSKNSFSQAATESLLSEQIISVLAQSAAASLIFAGSTFLFTICYSYLYIILSFETPEIRPFLGGYEDSRIKLSKEVDKQQQEKWIQNNTDLIKRIGRYYQNEVQGLGISALVGGYCIILYFSIVTLDSAWLIIANTLLIFPIITFFLSIIVGTIYLYSENRKTKYVLNLQKNKLKEELSMVGRLVPSGIIFGSAIFLILTIFIQLFSSYLLLRYVFRII